LEAALFDLDKQVARGFALIRSANLRKAEQQILIHGRSRFGMRGRIDRNSNGLR
jgi:hypothetical protein